ncbi:hypothetical protein, partial [Halapricum sp. CBA1109]|uniref:hypothetical protein n=1 Tax=Halapricum sp. CBA1109 TaxID=2668068 RepID=UPI001E63D084
MSSLSDSATVDPPASASSGTVPTTFSLLAVDAALVPSSPPTLPGGGAVPSADQLVGSSGAHASVPWPPDRS